MSRFVIVKDFETKVKRFSARGRKLEFKIVPVPDNMEPLEWFKGAIQEIVNHAMKGVEPTDKVGITFCGESFKEHGPGWLPFTEASKLTMKDIWDLISKIFQSNSQGMNTDTFCLGVTTVRLPIGSGNERRNKYNTFLEECSMRRGIVTISNNDNLCLSRALVVSIATTIKDPNYVKIRKDTGKLQSKLVQELLVASGVIVPEEGSGISQLYLFQEYLVDYKITVYEWGSKGRDIIFEGDNKLAKFSLNLLYHKGHYNVITSLTAAFCCSYFCENCHYPYNSKNKHRCGGSCPCCQQSPACNKYSINIKCADCNRSFRGQQCLEKHIAVGSLNKGDVCSQLRRCTDCLKTYKTENTHICGEIFCKMCSKNVSQDHLCFIRPDVRKPPMKEILFLFYDLETRQEKVHDEKIVGGKITQTKCHEPNLCVFQQRCDQCIHKNQEKCDRCGLREQVLKTKPIERFIEFILNQRKQFKKVTVIAHNGQAFDHQFLLKHLLYKTDLKPELIMRGTKIILMQLENVKFIDSLNYFPMSLSKLPRAFDLPETFKKGYFPHLFNKAENENYIGVLPEMKYYSPDTMKVSDREVFIKWYNDHKYEEFNLQRDLVDYCISDVRILTEACIRFRKIMLDQCNVCPFTEAVTIASACNLVFRRNFLKDSTIGIIPKNGYRNVDNQSNIAIQWLMWEETKRGIDIIHSGRQKEAVLCGVKVDGYCMSTKQIFEFHGCYYHGHTGCLKYNRDDPLHDNPNDSLNQRFENTVAKTERLRSFGYEVVEMWECEFNRHMKNNKDIENLKHHDIITNAPLNPRDAFYGGRTDNTKTYYKCKPGEKIKYIDVCSLYPWVCKYGKFPIGHPKTYVGREECSKLDLDHTDGLIKCKILPPQDLYHPVLAVKQNNKLMFTLCYTCSKEKNQCECNHSDDERALTGTFVLDEVLKAMEKGYKLLETYEVWSYAVEQYDKHTSTGGLFTAMMNKFLKMKQQASDWPSDCSTFEKKAEYIEQFLQKEGIILEFSEITNNPGLRSLAKLILNSFWGKFGQRENQPKTSIINKPSELYALFVNPSITILHLLLIDEETIVINWEYKEEAADTLGTVNVCIAAYTTAQARLKLYTYLEKLGERVLYYDTDSVIYVSKDGEYEPPTGEFVGDMTDELQSYGTGSYITEFVSGGAKNYALKIFSTNKNEIQTVCKVKGICLNYEASELINFESMKKMILSFDEHNVHIPVVSENIRRTASYDVVVTTEIKKYRPNIEKRRFLENNDSVPYGYKKLKTV